MRRVGFNALIAGSILSLLNSVAVHAAYSPACRSPVRSAEHRVARFNAASRAVFFRFGVKFAKHFSSV